MDVSTPDDAAGLREHLRTGGVATVLSTLLVVPGLVVPAYARVGAGILLLVGLALSARALASGLLAFVPRDPPERAPDRLPRLSVVITAYEEADVLPGTVAACRALDYPDRKLEVVLGYEAASTDGTGAVARRLADGDPRVRAVERPGPPAGKAAATNHALERATGDVIAVLDADQRPEPGAFRRAVGWFRDPDVWCVKGRCFGTNPAASPLALCSTVERGFVERTEFYVRDLLGGFPLFTGGQALFRATTLDRIGGFDESILLEDLDAAYRIRRAGGEIRVDPGVVTRESNPATFASWWHRRKRWARGGMQVARRYLGSNLLSGPPGLRARVDFATTLGAVVALPVLALAAPLVPLALARSGAGVLPGGAASPWGSPTVLACGLLVLAPVAVPTLLFALDWRDGRPHERVTYLAPLLLWPYFGLQALAVVAAFVEEFVLRGSAVYVTSTTPEEGK